MGLLILSIVTLYHLKKPKRVSKITLLCFHFPHWSRYQSEEFSPKASFRGQRKRMRNEGESFTKRLENDFHRWRQVELDGEQPSEE